MPKAAADGFDGVVVTNDRGEVRAAGGVVWRSGGEVVEVLLVHRPRYGDWTFPKGKADADEDDASCALREVAEETGLRCRLGNELPTVRYTDNQSRAKAVRYWEMEVVAGRFVANDEVDRVIWLPVDQAARRLSHSHDVELVAALGEILGGRGEPGGERS